MKCKRINTQETVDRDGNRYCGPMVVAALLGISTGEAAAQIRRYNDHLQRVKGTNGWELWRVLRAHGYQVTPMQIQKDERTVLLFGKPRRSVVGPTLAAWFKLPTRSMSDPYVVMLSDHWILVKGRKMVDTFTRGEWVFLGKCPHRRRRVKAAYLITREGSR